MTNTEEPQIRSLGDLTERAAAWDSEFVETARIPIELIEVTETALILDGNSCLIDQDARNRLFAKVGAPTGYVSKRSVGLQTVALQEHIKEKAFGSFPTIVRRGNGVFNICAANLVELTHSEVLNTVAEQLGKDAASLTMSRIDRAGGRLEVDLISPATEFEVRSGDIVKAGLHISHCRYGDEATQIQSFISRLVCDNGMTRRECLASGGIVRTRRLPTDHPQAKKLLLDQVRRLTARVWEKLEPQLQELKATTERRADVPQLLSRWIQQARFSPRTTESDTERRTVMDRLLAAWRGEGAEDTYWAAVNALTWVGTHDAELSGRQRRVLSLLGGLLAFSGAHICPRCFSVLSEPGHV